MEERRRQARRHLMHYLNVFNRETGEVIGSLVDINADGLRVAGRKPMDPSKVLRLRVEIPPSISRKNFIDLDAQGMWCRQGAHQCDAGLRFVDISREDVDAIVGLMADFCYPEGPALDSEIDNRP